MSPLAKAAETDVSDFPLPGVEILGLPFRHEGIVDLSPDPRVAAGVADVQHLETDSRACVVMRNNVIIGVVPLLVRLHFTSDSL